MLHMTNCRDWSQMPKQKISMNPPSPSSTIWREGNGRRWSLCRMSNESSERILRGRANRLLEGASLRDVATKSIATPVPKVGVSFLPLPPDEWSENADYQHWTWKKWIRALPNTVSSSLENWTASSRWWGKLLPQQLAVPPATFWGKQNGWSHWYYEEFFYRCSAEEMKFCDTYFLGHQLGVADCLCFIAENNIANMT